MMHWLRRVAFENWGLKLLALGISFSLWAMYASQPVVEANYNVPVLFAGVPEGLAVSTDTPGAVHMAVEGRATLLRRLTAGDFTLTVDLSRATAGENAVELNPAMADVPYGAKVLHISPEKFRVSLIAPAEPGTGAGR